VKSVQLGPVTVLGGFNAQLIRLCGERGVGDPNQQEVLLQEVMVRSNLSAVSLGCMASGPEYTYCSGEVRTTVDNTESDFAFRCPGSIQNCPGNYSSGKHIITLLVGEKSE